MILSKAVNIISALFISSRYNSHNNFIFFDITKENYKQAGLQSEALFRFCHRMNEMNVDNAEYGLLTAITIFRKRKNVRARKRVEKMQEIFVDTLQSYVMSHRTNDPSETFAKLLGVLVEVRSLSTFNKRNYLNLKLDNRQLPDFLVEIWDLECKDTKQNSDLQYKDTKQNSKSAVQAKEGIATPNLLSPTLVKERLRFWGNADQSRS